MPLDRTQLLARLAAEEITTETVDHPAVFTVAESLGLERAIPGGHTKNLLLDDRKGRLVLVVAEHDAEVDLKGLHKRLGAARFSFASGERMLELLGVTPGSVTPFGLLNDTAGRVELVVDELLLRHERLNFHPLENTATTGIARDDFLRLMQASGHPPRVLDVRRSTE
jgi:Ala-tRNA(Pro) deacylase